MSPAELDRLVRRRFLVEGGFLDEMEELLATWPAPPAGPYLSCSPDAFPGEDRLAPLPPTPREQIEEILSRKAPPFSLNSAGLVWKKAVLDGSIVEFFRVIGDQRIVVVGPSHLRVHERLWRWQDAHFVEIHPTDARKDRYQILQSLKSTLRCDEFGTVLLQCGSLSAWMVAKLHQHQMNCSVLDLGRALDFVDPETVLKQPWGAAHTQTLAWRYGNRIAAWREWIETGLTEMPSQPYEIEELGSAPIEFVEKKKIDFAQAITPVCLRALTFSRNPKFEKRISSPHFETKHRPFLLASQAFLQNRCFYCKKHFLPFD